MDKPVLAALMGLCTLTFCVLAHAQSISDIKQQSESLATRLAPVADGSIVDQAPFDGIPDGFRRNEANTVYLDQGRSDIRAVMEFDLIGLEGQTVSRATLELSLTARTVHDDLLFMPVELRTFSADGILRRGDFHRGQFVEVFDVYPATFDVPVAIDVTQYVQRAISSGQTFLGFSLRTTSGAQIDFGSLELGLHPALDIAL